MVLGFILALLALPPFFLTVESDLLAPARNDQLRSKRGRVVRVALAIFWMTMMTGILVAAIWLQLRLRFQGLIGFLMLIVPPFMVVYVLRFLGPSLTRFFMRVSRA